MKTQQQAREEFSNYWEALKAEYGSGAGSKSETWDWFIANEIDEDRAPKEAVQWKMPRSTKGQQ